MHKLAKSTDFFLVSILQIAHIRDIVIAVLKYIIILKISMLAESTDLVFLPNILSYMC